ncbi:MAG: topoisomerase C-terminal repeat-containing protein [Tannerella sp.]|nr:topoisomerase C-terminal repeat-containing protein [Tannerella sp.]
MKDATTVVCVCAGTLFEAKGSVIRQAGWRAVLGEPEETADDENNSLPEIRQGETLPILQSEILEKQTKPKPLHTEASLLSAMESAGREVEDEAEREAMKESGIGTPATRAAIIETLFTRDYIRRERKSLIPTGKGLAVHETVKDKRIANVALTGSWEKTLAQIEKGETAPDTFRRAIEIFTRQITTELLDATLTPSFGGGQGEVFGGGQGEASGGGRGEASCPKCKTAQVRFYPKVVKCSNPDCGLTVFRNRSEKELSDRQITELLSKGKTAVISGFKSKVGKVFAAALKFDENWQLAFDFPEKDKGKGKK